MGTLGRHDGAGANRHARPQDGKVSSTGARLDKADTRFTMIEALHSNVDGKLWTKTNGVRSGHANKLYQFDLLTKTFNEVLPPPESATSPLRPHQDLDNNVYGLDNIRRSGKSGAPRQDGETTYIDLRSAWAAQGEEISTSRIAYGSRNSMPTVMRGMTQDPQHRGMGRAGPVGAVRLQFDDVRYAWGADMSTDLVRGSMWNGEWSSISSHVHQYAPHRRAENPGALSSMWTEASRPQDRPHRAADAVTTPSLRRFDGFGSSPARGGVARMRDGGERRFKQIGSRSIYARRDRAGKNRVDRHQPLGLISPSTTTPAPGIRNTDMCRSSRPLRAALIRAAACDSFLRLRLVLLGFGRAARHRSWRRRQRPSS